MACIAVIRRYVIGVPLVSDPLNLPIFALQIILLQGSSDLFIVVK